MARNIVKAKLDIIFKKLFTDEEISIYYRLTYRIRSVYRMIR